MKIAAAYIRVSTSDQTEYSPESQIQILRDYAKKNDMVLPQDLIFRDDGISGRTAEKRPEFMRMIGTAKIKPKPFDVILVWKFSRFSRNREDAILYKSMLRKDLGIEVVSVSENIGDDKMSILIEAMIEAMDEYYSINLSEEVRRGMTERAKRGEVVSTAPFGYYIENKRLLIDNEKAEIVRMIFNKFNDGLSMFAIAQLLIKLGIQTSRGNNFQGRNVRYILTNPMYYGKIRWNTNGKNDYTKGNVDQTNTLIIDGVHEPIISKNLFDKTQEKLSMYLKRYESYNSKRISNAEAGPKGEYMLRGLMKCSNCGATMSRVKDGLNCCDYAHSRCNESHYISFNKLNTIFFSTVEKDMLNLNFQIIQKTTSFDETADFKLINIQIQKLNQVLKRHKEAYANGIDSIEEYKFNKEKVTSQISKLEDQLNKNSPKPKKIDKKAFAKKVLKNLERLKSERLTEKEKNELSRSFIDKIVFDKKSNQVDVFYYC